MNSFRTHISILSAIVVAFGITISSIHIHIDDHHSAETGQSITQDELHCLICGSVFKFNTDCDQISDAQPDSKPFLFSTPTEKATTPFVPFYDGRAPPFFV
ncbi:MAG: hypothetical protein JJU37_08100 [Balneolaceae bacterium]|nr:hypothetical protein [Balneolaceae bacterium]